MPWNRMPPREVFLRNFQNYQTMGKYEDEDETKMVCDHDREVCMLCPVDHRNTNMICQGMDFDKADMINNEQQREEDSAMNLLSGSRYVQAGSKEAQSLFEKALKHIEKEKASGTQKKAQCKPVEYQPPLYSMPDNEKNKKSSKKLSERYITRCVQCKSKILSERNAFKCKCLELWYCTEECQQKKPHIDCRKRTLHKGGYMEKIKSNMTKETYEIFSANLAFYNEYGMTREMLKADAEGGDVTAAWMVGVGNKFGVFSNDNCPIARNPNAKDKGKVAGESKAIKWFQKAADGGHPQAMSDLGQMLLDSDDVRTACDWIDLAREAGCNDHYPKLVQNCFLSNEPKVLLDKIKKGVVPDGRELINRSPNLGTMMLSYRLNYLRNNNWKCSNGTLVINSPVLEELDKEIEARSLNVCFVPGRGGATNNGTLQILKLSGRHPENVIYRFGNVKKDAGPLIDLYERNYLGTDENKTTGKIENGTDIMQTCSHSNETPIYCSSCSIIGKYRVFAVAHDLYAISTTNVLVGYGYQVTYANSLDNTITKETFKSYSRPEINSVLMCLMNNPADVHVYRIAQDPNLYWPIIWYYGSVHAALEKLGGHQLIKDVYHTNEIKTEERKDRKDIDSNLTAAFPEMPGKLGLICGNGECVKFDHLESFSKCGNCLNRRYCSKECLRADWKIHKKECIKKEKGKGESDKKQAGKEREKGKEKKAHDLQELETESEGTLEEEAEINDKKNDSQNMPKWKSQQKRKQKKKKF